VCYGKAYEKKDAIRVTSTLKDSIVESPDLEYPMETRPKRANQKMKTDGKEGSGSILLWCWRTFDLYLLRLLTTSGKSLPTWHFVEGIV
jgi:hypothetical protein